MMEEEQQKYTYEDYQRMLHEMAIVVKKYKNECIRQAARARGWQSVIDYPIKILLGSSVAGGAIEMVDQAGDVPWVKYVRTALEILILILLTTKDIGEFEKRKQKYTQAQALFSTFHNVIQRQIRIKKGFEGNREDVIKEITEAFENIKSSNIIIQDFGIKEEVTSSNTNSEDVVIDVVNQFSGRSRRRISNPKEEENMNDAHSDDDPDRLERGRNMSMVPMSPSPIRGSCHTALIDDMIARL